jgi:hypothetical protein
MSWRVLPLLGLILLCGAKHLCSLLTSVKTHQGRSAMNLNLTPILPTVDLPSQGLRHEFPVFVLWFLLRHFHASPFLTRSRTLYKLVSRDGLNRVNHHLPTSLCRITPTSTHEQTAAAKYQTRLFCLGRKGQKIHSSLCKVLVLSTPCAKLFYLRSLLIPWLERLQ